MNSFRPKPAVLNVARNKASVPIPSSWKELLLRLPAMVNDPNDPENLDYPSRKDVEKIRQKFPTVPVDIFTK